MTAQLNGTKINYRLRDQEYTIQLSVNDYSVSAASFTVNSSSNFSMNTENNVLLYFYGKNKVPSLIIRRDKKTDLKIRIVDWTGGDSGKISWTTSSGAESVSADYEISAPKTRKNFQILRNGKQLKSVRSDSFGKVRFSYKTGEGSKDLFEIRQE
jgi:hypothetical protein